MQDYSLTIARARVAQDYILIELGWRRIRARAVQDYSLTMAWAWAGQCRTMTLARASALQDYGVG